MPYSVYIFARHNMSNPRLHAPVFSSHIGGTIITLPSHFVCLRLCLEDCLKMSDGFVMIVQFFMENIPSATEGSTSRPPGMPVKLACFDIMDMSLSSSSEGDLGGEPPPVLVLSFLYVENSDLSPLATFANLVLTSDGSVCHSQQVYFTSNGLPNFIFLAVGDLIAQLF